MGLSKEQYNELLYDINHELAIARGNVCKFQLFYNKVEAIRDNMERIKGDYYEDRFSRSRYLDVILRKDYWRGDRQNEFSEDMQQSYEVEGYTLLGENLETDWATTNKILNTIQGKIDDYENEVADLENKRAYVKSDFYISNFCDF